MTQERKNGKTKKQKSNMPRHRPRADLFFLTPRVLNFSVPQFFSFLFFLFFVFCALFSVFCSLIFAGEPSVSSLPELTPQDRVLILAPHPDDESIATAGIIQRCVQNDIPVKIVYFTNGDNNELAFIVYEKRLVLKKKAFVHMGEVRRDEAVRAMAYLGLAESDLVFLGYPDFGTMEILTRHWDEKTPFRSMLTRVTAVPYKDSPSFGALYIGQNIIRDIKAAILDFQPTKIFVSHPADSNRDHRALNLFLRVVLWDLEGHFSLPQVYAYLVHVARWPMPRGFHPALYLAPPENLKDAGIRWLDLQLTEEEVWIKRRAISFYRSQIAYAPSYLYSFARQNELFDDFPDVRLSRHEESVRWQAVRIYPEMDPKSEAKNEISHLSYALAGQDLWVRLTLRHRFNKNFGIFLNLLGYAKDKDFARMPKIRISVGMRGIQVWDKLKKIHAPHVTKAYDGKSLVMRIPLALLGHPDRILAHVKTSTKDLELDHTAWRVIYLD